ncbi:MAG: DUF192 domain-containing protein [Steroidobacteraceae bacterium]|jgi:uncharacterized membrane protein (UPF0127 family)|nr:DUF192 domain-containing protein [Steroidobacteraceae bacterium]
MREARWLRRDALGGDVGLLQGLVCSNAFERARGLLGREPPPDATALVIEPCRAIHTVGMRFPIDVVFCTDRGLVLRIVEALPPGRMALQPGAARVLELRAGEAARLGLRVGDRLLPAPAEGRAAERSKAQGRARGAATVEFSIVALLVLVPLMLGVLQVGLLYSAHHALNHATFLAARAGAVEHGRREAMQRYLAKGLVALHLRGGTDLDPQSWGGAGAGAYARALAEVRTPWLTRLTVLSPTTASFADFGRPGPAGGTVLPVDTRGPASTVGPTSQQTRADATLLSLRVDYCHPLVVPLVDRLITGTLARFDLDPYRRGCYAANRLPLRAHALLHFATDVDRDALRPDR